MSQTVFYELFLHEELVAKGSIESPFVVGRQSVVGEADPVAAVEIPVDDSSYKAADGATKKLVVVSLNDRSIPRLLLRVDVEGGERLFAKNIHNAFDVQLPSRQSIRSQERTDLGKQGTLYFQPYQLRLSLAPPTLPPVPQIPEARDNLTFSFVNYATNAPPQNDAILFSMIDARQPAGRQEVAIQLVRTALEAFKQPSGSDAFFEAAAAAAIKMIDLDRVAVLNKKDNEWICRTQAFSHKADARRAGARAFSKSLLWKMTKSARTMIMEPTTDASRVESSMLDLDRAVASPIFGNDQSIVGALYGDRAINGLEDDRPIGELEAALLEVLATGISSSLAIELEQQLRNSMAQFFSPVVLSQLSANQHLLDSREADVSVLFCDIRGFSAVTEKIGPTKAIAWINDILTTLSECVLNHDGVLVDYVGDELMAMFGAPANQPDHATRACNAALEMLAQIGPLGEKWRDTVPSRFGFGIGINSGPASVGNTGSKKKFKYGPLGNTVNLASRVQGITKQIGVPGLITGTTADAIRDAGMRTRRLTQVRVVGIKQAIAIHQLCESTAPIELLTRYEQALTAFEQNKLNTAAGMLATLVQDHPEDRPTIILLSRTVEQLTQPDREFDPVWSLTQK